MRPGGWRRSRPSWPSTGRPPRRRTRRRPRPTTSSRCAVQDNQWPGFRLRRPEQRGRVVEVHGHPPQRGPVPAGLLQPLKSLLERPIASTTRSPTRCRRPTGPAVDAGDHAAVAHRPVARAVTVLTLGSRDLLTDQPLQEGPGARQAVGVVGYDDLQPAVEVVPPGRRWRLDRPWATARSRNPGNRRSSWRKPPGSSACSCDPCGTPGRPPVTCGSSRSTMTTLSA